MQSLLVLTLVLAQSKSSTPIDLGELKDKLQALADGKGHYIVYNPESPYESSSLFYGDGKTFYALPAFGGGKNGDESWDISFWDPRVLRATSGVPSISMADSGAKYTVTCGDKSTTLKPVKADELKKLLALPFQSRLWTRQPDRLLRDDTGNYFFVDRLRTASADDRRDFRVFMGPRSKMKLLPLKDIVDDSKGTIFATANGNLRLVSSDKKPMWIAGKTRTELVEIPIEDNARMIYLDLGPYTGQPLGTPCDEYM